MWTFISWPQIGGLILTVIGGVLTRLIGEWLSDTLKARRAKENSDVKPS